MQNKTDGGEAILEAFRNLGIDYILSSPGSEWSPVWEALARQKVNKNDGPIFIDCWHETLAVDMAMGYTQVTGKMQAVLLHAGAGLLQGSSGVHSALLAEVPMVVMSGEALTYGEVPESEPGPQWYRTLSIVGGTHRLLEPVVKWSNQITSPGTLYEMVVRAGEMAQRVPMGPIYLSTPLETMLHEWTPGKNLHKIPPVSKPQAAPGDIETVAKLLVAAKNPFIVTDSVGRDPKAFHALVALAELLAIPVVENRAAGVANFPKDHPLHQGHSVDRFLKETDLTLLVGSRVPWYPPGNRPAQGKIVALSDNPLKGYMVYQSLQADQYVEGDLAASLELLAAAARRAGIDAALVEKRAAKWRGEHDKMQAGHRAAEAKAADATPIDPLWLCAALRAVMPADTVYVDETITHCPMLQQHLSWNEPNSYFYPHGGLGQGLGVALGVKLAQPNRPVVSLIGDGAFLYNPVIQAFGASRDQNLPLLIVILNNRKYMAMQKNHLEFYPDGVAKTADLFHGVHIKGPDYAELGKPFGFHGEMVEDPAKLEGALRKALEAVNAGKTAIVNVMLSR